MSENRSSLENFLTGGHRFSDEELLFKFHFRMLSTIIATVIFFALLFAAMHFTDLNDIGTIHASVNLFYGTTLIAALVLLRRSKRHYTTAVRILLISSVITFTSALWFVPQDEFRIVWFYLLMFVAYITGGSIAGLIITLVSMVIIIGMHLFTELQLSDTAFNSALAGLVGLSLLTRIFTDVIAEYERKLLQQRKELTAFNRELEQQAELKTAELRRLNRDLEKRITRKIALQHERNELFILQSRLAAMGEMLSMIAHQWRQPLATMTLMISNAKISAMLSKTSAKDERMLDEISDTLIALSATIDEYQSYFEPGRPEQTVPIDDALRKASYFTRARMEYYGIMLCIDSNVQTPVSYYAKELVQILITLLNNAIDAVRDTDKSSRHIFLGAAERDGKVYITIEDNGGGIDPALLPQLFTTAYAIRRNDASGLGLNMAKLIVENYFSGSIEVSTTDDGTRYLLCLLGSALTKSR